MKWQMPLHFSFMSYHDYMCGIFGYVGIRPRDVALMTHHGLRDLEYRGYDSWGIAARTDKGIFHKKAIGKISDANQDELRGIAGKMAIGHSRWATHGGVTELNSHPHFNRDKSIMVIHNGIVENHEELRSWLLAKHNLQHASELFVSETDTEVIPHLIDYYMHSEKKNFEQAFVAMSQQIEGRYAVVAMEINSPYLLAVRDGSPLVIGRDSEGYYLASDVPAFLEATRTVFYPGDREYLKVDGADIMLRSLSDSHKVPITWSEITWDKSSATKEGYPHFMLKEILEQPDALDKAIRQDMSKLEQIAELIKKAEHTFFIGCGTAAKMAKLGELAIARVAGKFTQTFVGSEFAVYKQFLGKRDLVFAVSQSGETADVLEALEAAHQKGAKVVSLLNVVGSSIDRMSEQSLFINAGPEIAVASTKAATAQIAVLLLLAHTLGGKLPEGKRILRHAVDAIRVWLRGDLIKDVLEIAKKIVNENDCYIIGRGMNAPIANEAAIKIQEVSYMHAEGFPGGELKHGPIALIRKGTPCIALIANDETKRDMESNMTELKSRGAYVIGVSPEHNKLFDEWIQVPDVGIASPITNLIPIQLLAYHLAVLRGNDPDKPRNLAKSVTVK